MKQGAEDVGDTDRFGDRGGGMFVGGTDHLSRFDSSTGKEHALGLGPVIASGLIIDPGGAAHFSHHHDEGAVEQATIV